MIENGATSSRTVGRWLRFCFVVCTVATAPAFAAMHSFNPSIRGNVSYINNVVFVDDPAEEQSDTNTRVALHLPYKMQTKTALLSLRYDTTFDSFQEFQELDFVGHKVTARLATNTSPRSTLRVYGTFSLSQDEDFVTGLQTDPDEPDPVDPFLLQRTRRWAGTVRVIHRHALGRRWNLSTGANGSYSFVDPIDEVPNAPSTANLEDKQSAGVNFRLRHTLSQKTSIGGTYAYGIVHQERSGDENVHEVRLTLSQGVSKRVNLGFEAGGYRRTRESPDSAGNFDTTGFSWSLHINMGYREGLKIGPYRMSFRLGARPSTGGTLEGTSTNNSASVSLTDPRTRTWSWSLFSRFTNRVPFDRDLAVYNTFSTGFNLRKSLRSALSLRGRAEYVNQWSSDTDDSTGSFFRVSGGLSWFPFAGTRMAGR